MKEELLKTQCERCGRIWHFDEDPECKHTQTVTKINQSFYEKEMAEFNEKFWFVNNRSLHKPHGENCLCRSTLSYDIKSWIKEHDDRLLTEVQERIRDGKKFERAIGTHANETELIIICRNHGVNVAKNEDIAIIEQFKSKK